MRRRRPTTRQGEAGGDPANPLLLALRTLLQHVVRQADLVSSHPSTPGALRRQVRRQAQQRPHRLGQRATPPEQPPPRSPSRPLPAPGLPRRLRPGQPPPVGTLGRTAPAPRPAPR
eukprot:7520356-Pyramimonas_sp.AAC.1